MEELQIGLVPGAVLERADVTLKFCIRVLAEHDDGHIGMGLELTSRAELRRSARGMHRGFDTGIDRFAVREILLVARVRALPSESLPTNRPAAGLLPDVISTVARY